jgi:hypothetical protein
MSTAAKTERYTAEPAEYGWDIVDSTTGESIGVCPDEHEAVKTVQRTNALHSANVNRIERARIKREIHSAPSMAASREVLAAVLEDNPPALATMRVEALVACLRRCPSVRRRSMLRFASVSDTLTVEQMTDRQRHVLCAALRGLS